VSSSPVWGKKCTYYNYWKRWKNYFSKIWDYERNRITPDSCKSL